MTPTPSTTPLSPQQAVDLYFVEHRAKVLDLAAFLDRAERAGAKDIRLDVMRQALAVLTDDQPHKAKRALEIMSDPTLEPIAHAGTKGAIGVWPGSKPSAGGSR